MGSALASLHRLRPDFAGQSPYTGRLSGARIDPEARAAVDFALRHIEVRGECFARSDVVQVARQIVPSGVTIFRLGADLQRLVLRRVGVSSTSRRPDRGGPKLTSSTAMAIRATILLEIDQALGHRVMLIGRQEAVARLSADAGASHLVLTPDRRSIEDMGGRPGVKAIRVDRWIAVMDQLLDGGVWSEPCHAARILLVDRAWTLPNVDVLLILEICRRLDVQLTLVDDAECFRIGGASTSITYNRSVPLTP